jgi:APA family basic amino acid/polyamine antiporter
MENHSLQESINIDFKKMAELRREISLINLVLIAVGASVGVGIFLTPGKIADYMQNPSNTLFVWALGGLITILGAMTFAELGGMYPKQAEFMCT